VQGLDFTECACTAYACPCRSNGHPTHGGCDAADFAEAVAARTGENRSSMLQDVERGAPTEIDALCGAVVVTGRKLCVATPVNESLWQRVRALEAA
jgi:ketopantoate reductase